MTGNVVRLFAELPKKQTKDPFSHLTTSPHFELAWSAYPKEGRTRSSRKQAFAEWKKIAPRVGKEVLVKAVQQYAIHDKDAKRDCGAPAFHRWLSWGRWEHWISTGPDAVRSPVEVFPDTTIRAACAAWHSEEWCISYLDRCKLVDGVIVTTSATVFAKIGRDPVFKDLGMVVELR